MSNEEKNLHDRSRKKTLCIVAMFLSPSLNMNHDAWSQDLDLDCASFKFIFYRFGVLLLIRFFLLTFVSLPTRRLARLALY